ncbi:hypothetical protein SFUL_1765 [Streptomyces microflavus DSM 40593]|uniref:Uncharacterized protein n=1 Tax=Streptomyces microflavus DSM 40593 TaxID=1303692 RepID=N0CT29_STRMI|nr:hypothetical protein SFUL_1765 [Streptomyces microflavus DSM 40593]
MVTTPQPIRISIMGTHYTGKTTLLSASKWNYAPKDSP